MNELATKNNVELLVVTQENIHKVKEIASEYDELKRDIMSSVEEIAESFVDIGFNLMKISKKELYVAGGYNNIYEFAESEFNLKVTAVKNLIRIADKFCTEDRWNGYSLKDEYKKYSYSQLVELSSLNENEIDDSFSPDLTVKEIRENKYRVKLKEYFKNTLIDEKNIMLEEVVKKILDYDYSHGYKAAITTKPKEVINDDSIEKIFYFSFKNKVNEAIKLIMTYELNTSNEKINFNESGQAYYHGFNIRIEELKKDENCLFEEIDDYIISKFKANVEAKRDKKEKEKISEYLNRKISYVQLKKVLKYTSNLEKVKMMMDIFGIDENSERILLASQYADPQLFINDNISLWLNYNDFIIKIKDTKYEFSFTNLLKYVLKQYNSVNSIFDMIIDVLGPDQERIDLINKIKSGNDEEENISEVVEAELVEEDEDMSDE